MIKVKICGLRTSEEVWPVVEAGGDAIGVIIDVSGSPRNIDPKRARRIFSSVPPFIARVAVTVTKSPEEAISIYESTHPDVLQIHAFNSPRILEEIRRGIDCKLIGVLLLRGNDPGSVESATVLKKASDMAEVVDAILVDALVEGFHGGTGTRTNWSLARLIRDNIYPRPLILAGGLTPENVFEGVRNVKPYAVDVSSGVESSLGVKDEELIRRFILKAKGVETR